MPNPFYSIRPPLPHPYLEAFGPKNTLLRVTPVPPSPHAAPEGKGHSRVPGRRPGPGMLPPGRAGSRTTACKSEASALLGGKPTAGLAGKKDGGQCTGQEEVKAGGGRSWSWEHK